MSNLMLTFLIEPGVENFHLAAKEFHDIIRKIN